MAGVSSKKECAVFLSRLSMGCIEIALNLTPVSVPKCFFLQDSHQARNFSIVSKESSGFEAPGYPRTSVY